MPENPSSAANRRQAMANLHIWSGLLPGWLVFIVFLFGTVAFFQHEISSWMRPELHRAEVTEEALEQASTLLHSRASDAESWSLSFPPVHGGAPLILSWQPPAGKGEAVDVTLDPATGKEIAVRDTQGGAFLFRFHYNLHYMPWWLANYLVCIASLSMLVAILSGIWTHKRIFKDFFTLRFGKGQRSWLDGHNIMGVFALPFHLMITYTGLATLMFTIMPWALIANYSNTSAFREDFRPAASSHPGGHVPGPPISLARLVAHAERSSAGARPDYITVLQPGSANSVAEIWPRMDRLGGSHNAVILNAHDGSAIGPVQKPGAALTTLDMMIDLHTGRFSDLALRWLYFLSGMVGTAMIATGLILWTAKRRVKASGADRSNFGFQLVERLNIGMLAGAPAGIAAYFLGNRLLPSAMAHRADWEIGGLFMIWAALLGWSVMRPVKKAWTDALAVCALLFALIPAVNAATTARGLWPSLMTHDWIFAGMDLAMLVTAFAFAFWAWKVASSSDKQASSRRIGLAGAPA